MKLLENINLVNIPFSEQLPLSPLHWIISDRKKSIVVEAMRDGVHIHENPVGVLANNPPFDMQLQNLALYQNLIPYETKNSLSVVCDFKGMGKGYGSVGLPGDFSSPSRFVKTAYLVSLSSSLDEKDITLPHLFSLLRSVAVPKGSVVTEEGIHHTLYTCGIDVGKKTYSVSYYDSLLIKTVCMRDEALDSSVLTVK